MEDIIIKKLSANCPTVTILQGANIVVTNAYLDLIKNYSPSGHVVLNVTWQNQGTASGTLTPWCTVDGIHYGTAHSSVIVDVNGTYTANFDITGLATGIHTNSYRICR